MSAFRLEKPFLMGWFIPLTVSSYDLQSIILFDFASKVTSDQIRYRAHFILE